MTLFQTVLPKSMTFHFKKWGVTLSLWKALSRTEKPAGFLVAINTYWLQIHVPQTTSLAKYILYNSENQILK